MGIVTDKIENIDLFRSDLWNFLQNKKILILGFGREGRSTYEFIRQNSWDYPIVIADKNEVELPEDENLTFVSGDKYLNVCEEDFDLIIKSPGISVGDIISQETKGKITCQTDLFLKFCPVMTIGITGTKGKSTTAAATQYALERLGKKSILAGNIGKPAWDIIGQIERDSIVVLELSAFQLEFTQNSPHIGVILNLFEEHLDYYGDVEKYHNAKKNLVKNMSAQDFALLGPEVQAKTAASIIELAGSPSEKIDTSLIGEHSQYNLNVVLKIIELLGLDMGQARRALNDFTGLPHRLQFVAEIDGVEYYDDSISTAAETTIAAIEALGNVHTLILGGLDRGISYIELAQYLLKNNVSEILLLPDSGERILQTIINEAEKQDLDIVNYVDKRENKITISDLEHKVERSLRLVKNLEEAVNFAHKNTPENTAVLLSPASASYNMYKNFEERGEHFQKLVQNLL